MIADPELKMNREAYSVKSEKNESSLGNLRIRPRYSTHLTNFLPLLDREIKYGLF